MNRILVEKGSHF